MTASKVANCPCRDPRADLPEGSAEPGICTQLALQHQAWQAWQLLLPHEGQGQRGKGRALCLMATLQAQSQTALDWMHAAYCQHNHLGQAHPTDNGQLQGPLAHCRAKEETDTSRRCVLS